MNIFYYCLNISTHDWHRWTRTMMGCIGIAQIEKEGGERVQTHVEFSNEWLIWFLHPGCKLCCHTGFPRM